MKGLAIEYMPPETVVVKIEGTFSPEMANEYFNELDELKQSNQIDKPNIVFILNDLGDIPPQTREIVRKKGSENPANFVALVGASVKIRIMSGLLLKMIPTIGKAKFFQTREEAISWIDGQ